MYRNTAGLISWAYIRFPFQLNLNYDMFWYQAPVERLIPKNEIILRDKQLAAGLYRVDLVYISTLYNNALYVLCMTQEKAV